jgi:hypothetical protein
MLWFQDAIKKYSKGGFTYIEHQDKIDNGHNNLIRRTSV